MQTLSLTGLYLYIRIFVILTISLWLIACNEEVVGVNPEPSTPSVSSLPLSFDEDSAELSASTRVLILDYVDQIGKDFAIVELELATLLNEVSILLSQTDSNSLENVKRAWLNAYMAYEQTTVHRYFALQAFNDQENLQLVLLQYQINHWPIIPGYIDYVSGYPDSGIVSDINVELSSEGLREQHGFFAISEATLGFHVLEFLLWGANEEPRPVSDYLAVEELSPSQLESGYTLEQLSNNRRRELLSLVSTSLLEDFQSSIALWNSNLPVLSQQITKSFGSQLIIDLADAITSMLSEELLVRSLYPMLNGEFIEGVQSPYSESTQNAVSSQLSELERLLIERQTPEGISLDVIFSAISENFSEFFYQNFDASKSCLVLLYSDIDSDAANNSNQMEIEVVECINLLTNMIDHLDQLKFELLK